MRVNGFNRGYSHRISLARLDSVEDVDARIALRLVGWEGVYMYIGRDRESIVCMLSCWKLIRPVPIARRQAVRFNLFFF